MGDMGAVIEKTISNLYVNKRALEQLQNGNLRYRDELFQQG